MTSVKDFSDVTNKIVEALCAGMHPQKIILFGSRAYGTPDASSDIDLLIINESSQTPYKRIIEASRLISPYRRGWGVDLIVITPREFEDRMSINDQFLHEIVDKGKVLYAA